MELLQALLLKSLESGSVPGRLCILEFCINSFYLYLNTFQTLYQRDESGEWLLLGGCSGGRGTGRGICGGYYRGFPRVGCRSGSWVRWYRGGLEQLRRLLRRLSRMWDRSCVKLRRRWSLSYCTSTPLNTGAK
jgi:hypothetical protein